MSQTNESRKRQRSTSVDIDNNKNNNNDDSNKRYRAVRLQDPRQAIVQMDLGVDVLKGNPATDPLVDTESEMLLQVLQAVEHFWKRIPMLDSTDQYFKSIIKRFNVMTNEIAQINLEELESNYHAHMNFISRLGSSLARQNMLSEDTPHLNISERIVRLESIVHCQFSAVLFMIKNCRFCDENYPINSLDLEQFLLSDIPMEPFSKLIWELRKKAELYNYRRKDKYICKEIITPSGHMSRAWVRTKTIEEFVYEQTSFGELYLLSTKSTNLKEKAITDLEKCEYPNFPKVVANRYFHSFQNGVYDVWNHKFYDYEHNRPPRNCVAIKYHDCYFNPKWASEVPEEFRKTGDDHLVEEIEHINKQFADDVKDLNRILDDQGIYDVKIDEKNGQKTFPSDRACFKAFFLGKMLYQQCKKDKFQVFPVIMGRARTGKSSLAQIIQNFYEFEDICVLSSNIREDFGAQDISDKLLWMCTELKEKFKAVSPGDILSMASGESVSFNVKHKSHKYVNNWDIPFWTCGNEIPAGWSDNSGNMIRRIIFAVFCQPVNAVDNTLSRLLKVAMGAIIAQSNMFYRTWVRRYGHLTIDKAITPYFQNTLNDIKRKLNPIRAFLFDEHKIVRSTMLYMTESSFWDLLNDYCSRHNIPKLNKNTQQLGDVFDEAAIREDSKIVSRPFVKPEFVKCEDPSQIQVQNVSQKFYWGIGLRVILLSEQDAFKCYNLTPPQIKEVLAKDLRIRDPTLQSKSQTSDSTTDLKSKQQIMKQIEALQDQLKS